MGDEQVAFGEVDSAISWMVLERWIVIAYAFVMVKVRVRISVTTLLIRAGIYQPLRISLLGIIGEGLIVIRVTMRLATMVHFPKVFTIIVRVGDAGMDRLAGMLRNGIVSKMISSANRVITIREAIRV